MDALWNQPALVAAVVALGAAFLAAVLLIHRQLHAASGEQQIDWKRVQSFRGGSYRPMERLLSEEDYLFLRRQPGFQPAIADRLRRERVAIFRGYLSGLERDFHQLHLLARTLVRDQEQDRPELALALVKTSAQFRMTVLRIRLRLLLQSAHLDTGALRPADAKSLVDAAIWMQTQIRLLHAPGAASAVA